MQGPSPFPRTASHKLAEDCQGTRVCLPALLKGLMGRQREGQVPQETAFCLSEGTQMKASRSARRNISNSLAGSKELYPHRKLPAHTLATFVPIWEGLAKLGNSEKGVAVWPYSLGTFPDESDSEQIFILALV